MPGCVFRRGPSQLSLLDWRPVTNDIQFWAHECRGRHFVCLLSYFPCCIGFRRLPLVGCCFFSLPREQGVDGWLLEGYRRMPPRTRLIPYSVSFGSGRFMGHQRLSPWFNPIFRASDVFPLFIDALPQIRFLSRKGEIYFRSVLQGALNDVITVRGRASLEETSHWHTLNVLLTNYKRFNLNTL